MIAGGKYTVLIFFGLAIWIVYLFVTILFYITGPDASSYYYGINLMINGAIPTIDFLSMQPPGFFLPYFIFGKVFSPTFESLRILSLFSFIFCTLIVSYLVRIYFSSLLAFFAFMLMGFSHFWFYWNATIIHYSVSNFMLLLAFFLAYRVKLNRTNVLLIGIIAGMCVDSRLTMGPVTLGLLYILISNFKRETNNSLKLSFLRIGPLFVLGGLTGALPGLIILFLAPEAAYLNWLGLRSLYAANQVWVGGSNLEMILNVVMRRLQNIYSFFFWADMSQKAQIGNVIILIIGGLGVAGFFSTPKKFRLISRTEFIKHPIVRGCVIITVAVFFVHAFTIFPAPYYVNGIFPFLVIISLAAVHFGFARETGFRRRKIAFGVIFFALIPYTMYFLAWTGVSIVRRNIPSSGRPVTSAMVGCWLEKYTRKDAIVLSFTGLPVTIAKRKMPVGWAYPPLNTALASYEIDPKKAKIANILTRSQFLALFNKKGLDVYLENLEPMGDFLDFPEFHEAVRHNYKMIAETGGAFPFRIYVPKGDSVAKYKGFPAPTSLRVNIQRLKSASAREIFRDVYYDLQETLITFPLDFRLALSRVVNAPFNERCDYYLSLSASSSRPPADNS